MRTGKSLTTGTLLSKSLVITSAHTFVEDSLNGVKITEPEEILINVANIEQKLEVAVINFKCCPEYWEIMEYLSNLQVEY